MIDLTARNESNKEKQDEGVWAVFADGPRGFVWWLDGEESLVAEGTATARVRVRWAGNPYSREVARKERQKHQRILRQIGELPEHLEKKVAYRLIASFVADWADIKASGKAVPFSEDKALELVEASEDFALMIGDIANEVRAFRDAEREAAKETLGNS